MTNINIHIVEEYIEQIFNQKRLERLSEFCSEDCVVHAAPYVGLGVDFDDSSGEKLILTHIAPHGPADGHLQLGDELIRVKDDERTWETFDELRKGLWARGLVDTEIIMTVRRHGDIVTIPINRGMIDKFGVKASDAYKAVIPYLQHEWPNFGMDIREIFGDGDRVACYMVDHGTNSEYHRSATWAEMSMFKLKNGKITDIWYVENTIDQLEQLGYQITEPVRELA